MMFQQKWGIHEVSEQVYRGHRVGQSYGGRDIFHMLAKWIDGSGGNRDKAAWLIITHVPDEDVAAPAPREPVLLDPARSTVLA